jgi:hypothetical protein
VITEAVLRFILHCSRCNTTYQDEDFADGATALWHKDELDKVFPPNARLLDDCNGWKRIGDRVLCRGCWHYNHEADGAVELPPLPAVDAARLNREQAAYRRFDTPVGHLAHAAEDVLAEAETEGRESVPLKALREAILSVPQAALEPATGTPEAAP